MNIEEQQFVAKLHTIPGKGVVYTTGGGAEALGMLCSDGGASGTLEDFGYPYAMLASQSLVGGPAPVTIETARALAMAAYHAALKLKSGDYPSFGIGCTSKLARTVYDPSSGLMVINERPGRVHEIHVAIQTATFTQVSSVTLNLPTRREEEYVNALMILEAIGDAKTVFAVTDPAVSPILVPLMNLGGFAESSKTFATFAGNIHENLADVMAGKMGYARLNLQPEGVTQTLEMGDDEPDVIVSGSFNPIHEGHLGMIEIAKSMGMSVGIELCMGNADKPPLDYFEINRRVNKLSNLGLEIPLFLTRAGTFAAKSALFQPGRTFAIGYDTAVRITDPRFYGGTQGGINAMFDLLESNRTRFLVFGRVDQDQQFRCSVDNLPERFRALCDVVPETAFRYDVSSTQRRLQGGGN